MWLERYTIVVPTLTNPRLPYQVQLYHPTWVEVAITVASFSMLAFLYMLFVKLFPIISIWEIQEGRELAGHHPAPATGADGVAARTESDGKKVERTLERHMVGSFTRSTVKEQGEFYFKIHVLVIAASVAIYLTVIGWMIWRLIEGGWYEFSVIPVVSCVLLAIILAATRSMVAIASEGRPRATELRTTSAQAKRVSVEQWAIPTPRKTGQTIS
jgi:hypothetical protein